MRVEIEWKKLGVAIGKITTDLVAGNAGEAIKSGVEAAEAFGWDRTQPPNAEEGAALLLHRTLCAAVLNTFRQFAGAARPLTMTADPVEIQASLFGLAGTQPVELTAEAFSNPSAWRAIDVVQAEFAKWQTFCRVAETVRDPMLRFFRQEVPLALTLEMRKRPDDYASLLHALAHLPGDEAARFEAQWRTYRAELVRRVREPLFRLDPNELPPVGLADIYVPLRAWMTVRGTPEKGHRGHAEDDAPRKKRVVWLEDDILEWLKRADHRDGVRVIGGEPGAGKSSFTKIIAAKLAHENQRILLVPLGRLNYHADALQAVTAYVSHPDELGHDPFAAKWSDTGEPMLLILDGLDELAKAGQGAEEIVASFVGSLLGRISELNHGIPRIFVLLGGGQALSALPASRSMLMTPGWRCYGMPTT